VWRGQPTGTRTPPHLPQIVKLNRPFLKPAQGLFLLLYTSQHRYRLKAAHISLLIDPHLSLENSTYYDL